MTPELILRKKLVLDKSFATMKITPSAHFHGQMTYIIPENFFAIDI